MICGYFCCHSSCHCKNNCCCFSSNSYELSEEHVAAEALADFCALGGPCKCKCQNVSRGKRDHTGIPHLVLVKLNRPRLGLDFGLALLPAFGSQ